jgi:hypothetical protein
MIIFCSTCRSKLVRENGGWLHRDGEPADGHAAQPLAARRKRLFDPGVVGLPGYDRMLAGLVKRERASGKTTEIWRLGVYVFDGRIQGAFRCTTDASKVPAKSIFQPPPEPSKELLRDHPVVKARLSSNQATA